MAPVSLPINPTLARKVKAETLEPHQQVTATGFKTASDFRQKVMLKHPFLSDFHSRAEYLHAGLLEGDPSVISYIPQPFLLRVGQRRYTPDCYVVRESGPRQVIELTPRGEMDEEQRVPLTHFFAQQRMAFVVRSNESVLEREIEAENWLEIVTILHQAAALTTEEAEEQLIEEIRSKGASSIGDLIDPGDRERTYYREIAMFRLLHRGQLRAELTEHPLNWDTGIAPCE